MLRILVLLFVTSSAWGAKKVLPDLHTTMYYGEEGLVSRESKGLVIFYGGTGGKTQDYGIEKVVERFAGRLKKMGWDVVAFENPLYWDNHLNVDGRQPILEKYGSAEAQTQWLVDSVQYVLDQKPSVPVWAATRSTTTGAMMQLMHEAHKGLERGRILESIQGVFAQGVLDPRKEAVDVWYAVERKFLTGVGRADLPVLELDPVIFPQYTFVSEAIEGRSRFKLPAFYVPMGAMDEVATLEQQLVVIDLIAKFHPDLSILGVGMDTHHNPEASIEYVGIDGKTVKIRTMDRLRPVLTAMLGGDLASEEPGLRLMRGKYLSNYPGLCNVVLDRFAEASGF